MLLFCVSIHYANAFLFFVFILARHLIKFHEKYNPQTGNALSVDVDAVCYITFQPVNEIIRFKKIIKKKNKQNKIK